MKKTSIILLCAVFCFLLAGCRAKSKQPQPEAKKYEYGHFYTDGNYKMKWIALTFDDGPNPKVLDRILGILKKEKVPATFFVVGCNVRQYPEYIKKYIENGHEIGNHTYGHRNYYALKEKVSVETFETVLSTEIDRAESAIIAAGGAKPLFMRMPNGFSQSPAIKKLAKEKQYLVVNWTFGCDWEKYDKNGLVKKYSKNISPGAIFLMHEKSVTADALPEIIAEIKRKGYEIVTLRKILDLE